MGHKYFFYTEPEDANLMTLDEVKAGVRAVKAVAEQHLRRHELRIDPSPDETAIVIRGAHLTEDFCFQPHALTDGACTGLFLIKNRYNCCKTDRAHESEVVEEMLRALRTAVHNKLRIDD